MTGEDRRLVYVYAEYCPGVFFWGWWLYMAPVVDGKVRRDDRGWHGCEWLHKMEWKLDHLNEALGLPVLHDYRGTGATACAEAFLEKFPNGAVLWEVGGREFEPLAEGDEAPPAWLCLKQVREGQLLDWRQSDDSYLDRYEDAIRAQHPAAEKGVVTKSNRLLALATRITTAEGDLLQRMDGYWYAYPKVDETPGDGGEVIYDGEPRLRRLKKFGSVLDAYAACVEAREKWPFSGARNGDNDVAPESSVPSST